MKPMTRNLRAHAHYRRLLVLCHGCRKSLLGNDARSVPSFIIYGAGSIELIGALIMIGLLTRWAAFTVVGDGGGLLMAHGFGAVPVVNGENWP
jgi:hypothetical protein